MMHTPGPWIYTNVSLFDDIGDGLKVRDKDGFQIVAVVRGPLKLERSKEEWEANAHLVAAAPELLAACEMVARCLELGREPNADRFAMIIDRERSERMITLAIAKAKGEHA